MTRSEPIQGEGYVSHMTINTACSIEGDSGGPVLSYNTATGIVIAGNCSGGSGSETDLMGASYAAASLNVTIASAS